jgi:hypothetical protein
MSGMGIKHLRWDDELKKVAKEIVHGYYSGNIETWESAEEEFTKKTGKHAKFDTLRKHSDVN